MSSGSVSNLVGTSAVSLSQKQLNNSLATTMVVVGAVALIPSALGVAQYTTASELDKLGQNKSIYIAQAFFVAIATVIIALGIVLFIIQGVAPAVMARGGKKYTSYNTSPSAGGFRRMTTSGVRFM